MSDEHRVLEVSEQGALAVRDVTEAAANVGATLALVVVEDRPIAILRITELDETDETPIVERAKEHEALEEWDPASSEPGDVLPGLTTFVESDLVVLQRDEARFVLPRAGRDLEDLFARSDIQMFAADTQLPGPPTELPRRYVTYSCLNGHLVKQLASNSNRICGYCGLTLEPT